MLFSGNFTVLRPSSLLIMLCQEQRSVEITTVRHIHKASITVWHGAIVAATCGDFVDEEAVYHWLCWEEGQFFVTLLDAPPADANMHTHWEELMLEAARRRDEASLCAPALPAPPTQQYADDMLAKCPALMGLAIMSSHGQLLVSSGMPDSLLQHAEALAMSLMNIAQVTVSPNAMLYYDDNSQQLALLDIGNGQFVLAIPAPDVNSDTIRGQLLQLV